MPFSIAAAGITAGAGLLGSSQQASAVKDAAKQNAWARQLAVQQEQQNYNTSYDALRANQAAAQAQLQANYAGITPEIRAQYDRTQQAYAPYSGAGSSAETAQADLLGLNGPEAAARARANYQTSPGYQWQMEQGLRAVDAGAAAKGMTRSGATLRAEETYGQGLANQDFGQYYSRLNTLSGQGLVAANATTTAGQNMVTDLSNAGNYLTTGTIGSGEYATTGLRDAGQNLTASILGNSRDAATANTNTANALSSIYSNTASGLGNTLNNLLSDKDFKGWASGLFSGGSSGSFTPATFGNDTGFTIGGFSGGNNPIV